MQKKLMENVWKKLINLVITTEVFHVDGKNVGTVGRHMKISGDFWIFS
jgi:hypothetical protein